VALYLPLVTFDHLPLLIFGVASFVSALLTFLLPETLGAPLVESFEELIVLRNHAKPLLSWWSSKQVDENIEKFIALRTSKNKINDI
jgi:hypothetical protein